MKSKIFIYDLEIYKRRIVFAINVSYNKMIRYMKDNIDLPPDVIPESNPTSQGKCILFQNGWHVVWVRNRLKKKEQTEVLLHELFHLTCHIMQEVGCPMTENQEEYAYLYEFLFKQVIKNIN